MCIRDRLEAALGEVMAEDPTFVQDLQVRYFSGTLNTRQPSFTRQETAYIGQAGPVEVLLYTRPPWSWTDPETGQVQGITVDILAELGRRCV